MNLQRLPPGIRIVIDQMKKLAKKFSYDATVRLATDRIVEAVRQNDHSRFGSYRVIEKIFNWAKTRFKFSRDPARIESLRSPALMIAGEAYGDADDASLLLASMLMAAQVPVRFRLGGTKRDGELQWHHVWVQALYDHKWLDMDITRQESSVGWYWRGFDRTGIVNIGKPK